MSLQSIQLTLSVRYERSHNDPRKEAEMRYFRAGFFIAITTLISCGLTLAEDAVLVVHVVDPSGTSIVGIVLSSTGDSSTGAPTDNAGKTRIKLALQTKPGSEVTLVVVNRSQDLVFISPWNNRVTVPPFENTTANVVEVVLAEKGSRLLLEYPQVALAM